MINLRNSAASAAVATAILCATNAEAQTLTFDDLSIPSESYAMIDNGYQGLNWSNFYMLNPAPGYAGTGYRTGLVSGSNVVFNGSANDAQIGAKGGTFSLTSGYFTSGWAPSLTITLTGMTADSQTLTTTFDVFNTGPTFETINWTNLVRVNFSGPGSQMVIDNLTLNPFAPVPEPASWTLMLCGFGLVGGAKRRRISLTFARLRQERRCAATGG